MNKMDVNLFLRAVAILAVVFNHAYIDRYLMEHSSIDPIFFGLGFSGGAVVLMLISGYNFAEFILSQSSASSMKSSIWKLAKSIAIPSFLVVLFFFVILSKFDIYELLFIRNWVDAERISKFPTWYPQVMLQILVVLLLILPMFYKYINRNPWVFSLVCFAVSITLSLSSLYLFSINMWEIKLPHLYLWIFVLGWMIFYARRSNNQVYILMTIALLVITSWLVIDITSLRFYWTIVAGGLLLFCKNIKIPKLIKPILSLVAQATFTLFLFHRFFFEVYEKIVPYEYSYVSLFIFSVCASLLLWITATSFKRVYKRSIKA
jgi:peptidoglycan/LPS O-acetylase OafA/YrhL